MFNHREPWCMVSISAAYGVVPVGWILYLNHSYKEAASVPSLASTVVFTQDPGRISTIFRQAWSYEIRADLKAWHISVYRSFFHPSEFLILLWCYPTFVKQWGPSYLIKERGECTHDPTYEVGGRRASLLHNCSSRAAELVFDFLAVFCPGRGCLLLAEGTLAYAVARDVLPSQLRSLFFLVFIITHYWFLFTYFYSIVTQYICIYLFNTFVYNSVYEHTILYIL
jgi:hypothetical protein